MSKKFYSLLGLTALMALTGCVKEEVSEAGTSVAEGKLQLVAEGSGAPGSKVVVDGTNVYWSAGEPVTVNGAEKVLAIESDGNNFKAYIDINEIQPTSGGKYYVGAPRNLFIVPNGGIEALLQTFDRHLNGYTGRIINFLTPSEYDYEEDGGRQKITGLPMFGWADASNPVVTMKHLTAAVSVSVTNSARLPILVDSVVLNCDKLISGTIEINIKDFTFFSPMGGRRVKMDFTDLAENNSARRIAASATKNVQVPILPITDGTLTVKVYFHVDWDAAIASDPGVSAWKNASYRSDDAQFSIQKSTENTITIARNQLVNAPMEITMDDAKLKRGLFKIGANKLGAVTNGSIGGSGRKMTSTEMRYLLASQDVLKSLNTTEYVSESSYSGVNYTHNIQVNMLCVDPNHADNIDNGSFQAEWYRYTVTRPDNGEPDRTNSIFYAYRFEDNVVLYPNVYEVSGWYTVNSGGLYTWSRPLSWGTTSSVGSNNASHSYTYNESNANFYVYVVE